MIEIKNDTQRILVGKVYESMCKLEAKAKELNLPNTVMIQPDSLYFGTIGPYSVWLKLTDKFTEKDIEKFEERVELAIRDAEREDKEERIAKLEKELNYLRAKK